MNFKSEISNLKLKGENISKQLHGWIECLKNTAIKGNKFLTHKERQKIAHEKQFEEFDAQMEDFRRRHLEMRERRQQDTAILNAHPAND